MTVVTELEAGDRQVLTLHDPSERNAAFEQVCRLNPEALIEQNSEGDIIIVPPVGLESGDQSTEVITQLNIWAKQDGTGKAFDSSTGFLLPNGAKRSPDAAWLRLEKIRQLPKTARRKISAVVPDFAIEVLSPSDRLKETQDKCREYIANGTAEAWLIDAEHRTVWTYSQAQPDGREQAGVDSITSETLPGFTLDLRPVWQGLDV